VFAVNDVKIFLIETFLTFLQKEMLDSRITSVVYFGHFCLLALNLNFSHKNDVFLNLSPNNEMNLTKSRFFSVLRFGFFFSKLNIFIGI